MRLKRPVADPRRSSARIAALTDVKTHLEQTGVRPCDGCERSCACQQALGQRACGCGPGCADAAERLSSEPDRYPIEEKILPLVYGLARLGHVTPCWSCEGHSAHDNGPTRSPQVWFHVNDVGVATLIGEFLQRCWIHKVTRNPWQLRILALGDVFETVFSIEPDAQATQAPLPELQADAAILGERVCEDLHRLIETNLPPVLVMDIAD